MNTLYYDQMKRQIMMFFYYEYSGHLRKNIPKIVGSFKFFFVKYSELHLFIMLPRPLSNRIWKRSTNFIKLWTQWDEEFNFCIKFGPIRHKRYFIPESRVNDKKYFFANLLTHMLLVHLLVIGIWFSPDIFLKIGP